MNTTVIEEQPQWFINQHFNNKLEECSKLFIALAPALISNIVFQSSDSPTAKRVLTFILGVIIQFFLFYSNAFHSVAISVSVYFLTKIFKSKSPAFVIAFVLVYAVGYYQTIDTQYPYNIWKDLYKFSLIPLLCKCISFSFCYADGFKSTSSLSIDQEKRRIVKFPTFLLYFAYMFHHVSAFFGPPLDYYEFSNFTSGTVEYENYDRNLKGSFVNIFLAIFALLGYILLTSFIDASAFYKGGFPKETFWLQEIFLVCALGMITKLLYYCVAMISQATIEFCGLSYIGMDKNWKSHYGRIKVVNSSFIVKNDIAVLIESWNPSYYVWLKRYIYARLVPLSAIRRNIFVKTLSLSGNILLVKIYELTKASLAITFLLFGFPLPGAIAYLHLLLLVLVGHYMNRAYWRMNQLSFIVRIFGAVLKWSFVYLAFSVFVAGIQINDWEIAISLYKRVGYIPILIELCLLAFFLVAGREQVEEAEEKTTPKENKPLIIDETRDYLQEILHKKEEERFSKLKKTE